MNDIYDTLYYKTPKDETKVMLEVYRRSLTGDASDEEQEFANDQFMDLLRIAGMATFCGFIPGSTLALPLAIAGAKKMGIRLLPSAFDKETDEHKPSCHLEQLPIQVRAAGKDSTAAGAECYVAL